MESECPAEPLFLWLARHKFAMREVRWLMNTLSRCLFLVALVAASACTKKNPEQTSRFRALLAQYRDTTFDSLEVVTRDEVENSAFRGVKIQDSNLIASLPVAHIEDDPDMPSLTQGYYTCLKFKLDSTHDALITRLPFYVASSTAIRLFLFDAKRDTITDYMPLADRFGDHDVSTRSTMLLRSKNGGYQALQTIEEVHPHEFDGDESDTASDYRISHSLYQLRSNNPELIRNDSQVEHAVRNSFRPSSRLVRTY